MSITKLITLALLFRALADLLEDLGKQQLWRSNLVISRIRNFCWKIDRHQITFLHPVLPVPSVESLTLAVDSFMRMACFSGR